MELEHCEHHEVQHPERCRSANHITERSRNWNELQGQCGNRESDEQTRGDKWQIHPRHANEVLQGGVESDTEWHRQAQGGNLVKDHLTRDGSGEQVGDEYRGKEGCNYANHVNW